jgi:hypothetical protein
MPASCSIGRVTRLAIRNESRKAISSAPPPPMSSAFSISRNGASSRSNERRKMALPIGLPPETSGSVVKT